MIPFYKSTLTRLDLSSVLGYMVDNELEGRGVGQVLAKEYAQLSGFSGAITLRNPFDAIYEVLELLEIKSVLLPYLAPRVLCYKLESLGYILHYYDIDPNTLAPINPKDKTLSLDQGVLFIDIQYFGAVIDCSDTSIPNFETLPKLTIRWTFERSLYEKSEEKSQAEIKSNNKSQSAPQKNVNVNSDFCVLILEHNTICTSGGGVVLLVRNKQHSKSLKIKLQDIEPWFAMTDFNAGLALAQFKQSKEFISRIKNFIPFYKEAIQKSNYLSFPSIFHEEAIPQCFPIITKTRVNDLIKYVKKQGIECNYPFQDSQLATILESPSSNKDTILNAYPNSVKFVTNTLAFPLYTSLSKDELQQIVKVISSLP